MADQKISQLAGGGAALATDEIPIARSGANYKITGANIAAAATSVGTLASLTVSGNVTVNTNTFFVDTVNNRVGIGIASPSISPLHVQADENANRGLYVRNINTGTAAYGYVAAASLVGTLELRAYSAAHSVFPNRAVLNSDSGFTNGLTIVAAGATPIEMWTNGTRRLTVDSTGNLGLGTNTPSFLLDINGNSRTRGELYVFNTSGTDRLTLAPQATGSGGKLLAVNAANNAYTPLLLDGSVVQLQTSAVTRLTLDANGNLGLGVTPSAWDSANFRAIQIGAGGTSYFSLTAQTTNQSRGSLLWNAYGTGNETFAYVTTGDNATRFSQQYDFRWFTASSGTAGSAITFTERLRLDSSGNLGLGITPSAWNAGSALQFLDTVGIGRYGFTRNAYQDSVGQWRYISTAAAARLNIASTGAFEWQYAASGTAGAAMTLTVPMTLDASGQLSVSNMTLSGISPFVTGANITSGSNQFAIGTQGASDLGLYANNTERARVKRGGQVRYVPLAAAPTTNVEDGDVYYDSGTNKLRVRAGGAWVDLH